MCLVMTSRSFLTFTILILSVALENQGRKNFSLSKGYAVDSKGCTWDVASTVCDAMHSRNDICLVCRFLFAVHSHNNFRIAIGFFLHVPK